jgi:UDP-2,3-diacylglucosamine pyrophosphatase LpxH
MKTGQIVVIGDSHIGLTDGSELPVIAWLERLALTRPAALYLNGDVFHYLIADPKFYTRSVEAVFARMKELRDQGVSIHYVEGNRDFFLDDSFVEDSVTDIGLEYAVQAGARKYLIVHGDMINDRDLPYRFWRRVSKNAISRFALRLIPRRVARRFVDGVEHRLAESNFKHKSRLPIELMEAYGRRRRAEGFNVVVFGHFHHKTELDVDGGRVTVLPAWYESGEAMVIDPNSGEYTFETI